MSKKPSDTHITKSSNDEDDTRDDTGTTDTPQPGSADELTRRPMRSMRRLASRAALSDNATRSPKSPRSPRSPRSPTLRASTRPTSSPAGVKVSTPTRAATAASTSTSTSKESKPPSIFGGFTFGTSASNDSTAKPAFSKDAFSFNIGGSGKALPTNISFTIGAPPSTNGDSVRSSDFIDQEAYERALSGVNFLFVKKVQKELKYNPAADLSILVNQYLTQRNKVKCDFEGLEEPGKAVVVAKTSTSIVGNSGGGNESGFSVLGDAQAGTSVVVVSKSEVEGTPEQNQPQETREVQRSNSTGNLPNGLLTPTSGSAALSSHFSPSYSGSFTSSSVKGAVDPPRNPTSYWSNTRVGGSQGPSASPFGRAPRERNPSPSTSPTTSFGSTFRRPFASAFTGVPTSSTPASSLSLAAAAQSGAASKFPKPFALEPQKPKEPFVFDRTKFTAPGAGPTEETVAPASDRKRRRSPDEGDDLPNKNRNCSADQSEAEGETKEQEEEVKVFEVRAKLFKLDNGVYKELGVGQFLVNENVVTKKRRMFMRHAKTGLVIMNNLVIPQLPPKLDSNTIRISAIEGKEPRHFTVRVKEKSSAAELFSALVAGENPS